MAPYVLRGLLTEDGEVSYDEYWICDFVPSHGGFLAGLVEEKTAGDWAWEEGRLRPFHWPTVDEFIETYLVDTVEELDEIVTGGSIPDEILTEFREDQRQWVARQTAAR